MLSGGQLDISSLHDDTMIPGRAIERLSQFHERLPVFGGEVVRQLDGRGIVSVSGRLYEGLGYQQTASTCVHEFVRLAEQHNLPRVATVQNVYCLISRALENGLDETMHRLNVSLIPYSPLAFGALTGKYDAEGLDGPSVRESRLSKFERMRNQRWARPEALAAARRYNALAREHGLTPTRMALAWCYTNWRVASTPSTIG